MYFETDFKVFKIYFQYLNTILFEHCIFYLNCIFYLYCILYILFEHCILILFDQKKLKFSPLFEIYLKCS